MSDNIMVQLKNVNVKYGDKAVFNGLDITVKKGERVCIYGESGSGKTTLLRLILSLLKPDTGEIAVNTDKISVMFQEDRLLNHRTLYGNMKAVGISREAAEEYLKKVGLSSDIKKRPSQLSGGMKRRAALARALAFPADLFVLDEPTTGLDEKTKIEMLELIKKETANATLIMITHDEQAAHIIGAVKYHIENKGAVL